MVLLRGAHGNYYRCPIHPLCDMGVSCHPGSSEPMGTPADAETRRWRNAAHRYFDATWSGPSARMTRAQAYQSLREALGLNEEDAHIGRFDKAQCRRLIALLFGQDNVDETLLAAKAVRR